MIRTLPLLSLLVLTGTVTTCAQKPADPRKPVDDVPGLPRVLLIGDSISMGYTLPVREALSGVANVHRPNTNCESTAKGVTELEQWLGEKKWDVIHFNFGLHDLKYVNEKKVLVAVAQGKQLLTLEEYEKNLREIVARLKKTGAVLIWRNTTPVPEGANGRVPGDEVKYNEVALKVMRENEVEVEDLYAFALPKLKEIQLPKNVHFTDAGSKVLADHVAGTIRSHLKKP